MKYINMRIRAVVLALCAVAACTCEVSLGSPGANTDAPAPAKPAPTLTQQAAAIDPAAAPVVVPAAASPQPEPTGFLSDASVRKTEARHHNELRFCMEQGGAADAPQVRIQFVVKEDGSVGDRVEVLERTQASDRLATCLVQAVKRWKFETPKGGAARATLLLKR